MLWISGDTVLYDGVREVADRLRGRHRARAPRRRALPDLGAAALHDDRPRRGRAVRPASGPRTAIPVHYEGWSHFQQDRAAIERELAAAPDDVRERFRFVPIGTAVELPV